MTVKAVTQKLRTLKVNYGIDDDAITHALETLEQGALPTKEQGTPPTEPVPIIAQGVAPVHGQDAQVEWFIAIESQKRSDRIVLPDQLITARTRATKGEAGKNVYGKPLRARPGIDPTFNHDDGVVKKPDADNRTEFHAKWLGVAEYTSDMLSVHPLLSVSEDGMAVTMDIVGRSADAPACEVESSHVLTTLKQLRVRYGFHEDLIRKALELAFAPVAAEQDAAQLEPVLVASGKAPIDGQDAQIEWFIDMEDPDERNRVVLPQHCIAIRTPPSQGEPGKNVFDAVLPANPGNDCPLTSGDGVVTAAVEGRDEYRAQYLGVVAYSSEMLTIPPMLSVSEDGMETTMDLYARSAGQHGSMIEAAHVQEMLDHLGIRYGIQDDLIRQTLEQARASATEALEQGVVRSVVVAKGKAPQDGVDAQLTLDQDLTVGRLLPDGRIDFHEQSYPWNVKKGQVIGHLTPPQPAEDGMTARGETVPAVAAKEITLKLTGIEQDNDGTLTSTVDGAFTISGNTLSVADCIVVDGDVDNRTGNVHTQTNVLVKGYVAPGFILEAQGDVMVNENVENAIVRASGNVIVRGGVRGPSSEIYAGGTITVGFVEYGMMQAAGNIEIKESAIEAHLISDSDIRVGPSPGALIACRCEAVGQLWTVSIGRPSSESTEIQLGLTHEKQQRLRVLLDQNALTPDEQTERDRLSEHAKRAELAALRIKAKIASDVHLHIGTIGLRLDAEVGHHDYYLDPEEPTITFRPYNPNEEIPRTTK